MMETYDLVSIIISCFAAVIATISFFTSKKNSSAMIELSINERITNTKEKVSDISNIMTPFIAKEAPTSDEKRMLDLYEKQFDLAVENNLNSYEEACAKYLDKKVDKKRFKKLYKSEIKGVVENKNLKRYFDGVSSKYKAILKVYKKWEDLEN